MSYSTGDTCVRPFGLGCWICLLSTRGVSVLLPSGFGKQPPVLSSLACPTLTLHRMHFFYPIIHLHLQTDIRLSLALVRLTQAYHG